MRGNAVANFHWKFRLYNTASTYLGVDFITKKKTLLAANKYIINMYMYIHMLVNAYKRKFTSNGVNGCSQRRHHIVMLIEYVPQRLLDKQRSGAKEQTEQLRRLARQQQTRPH